MEATTLTMMTVTKTYSCNTYPAPDFVLNTFHTIIHLNLTTIREVCMYSYSYVIDEAGHPGCDLRGSGRVLID